MTATQLRKSILKMAVQGKLVSQDPNDEPASALLEKIRKERARLIQQGKIKKPKTESRIFRRDGSWWEQTGKDEKRIDDEIPFAIPESWEWVRLGEITFNNGQTIPNSTFCYIDIGSIDNKKLALSPINTVLPPEEAPSRARKIVKLGDIIYSTVRPYLHNTCIIDREFPYPPIASTGFDVLSCGEYLCNRYLFHFLTSPDFDHYANHSDNSKGVAYPAINDARFYQALIPLPPFAEQTRIAERLDEILPHVEEYGKAEHKLTQLNSAFPAAFKKSILQHAIQGKLVPQDPNDEPASALLAKIRKERARLIQQGKIKKPKTESRIFRRNGSWWEQTGKEEKRIDAEIPFAIPESWEWVRLGGISNFGYCQQVNPEKIDPDSWILELEDIEKDTGLVIQYKKMEDIKSISLKNKFYANNLLYSKLRPYLNKVVIAHQCGYCSSEILPIEFPSHLNIQYLHYLLRSPYFVDYAISNSYGVKMPRLGIDAGKAALLPLPPLAEQTRIAAKLAQFMAIDKKLGEALGS